MSSSDSTDASSSASEGKVQATTRPEVLIATPAYNGAVTTHYFESMIQLARVAEKEHNIGITVTTISTESLITRARNMMVAQFMDDPKFTHLLFVDADIGFPPEAVVDLIKADFPVSACPYPRKSYDFARFKKSPDENIANCMSYIINIIQPTEDSAKGVDIPVFKDHFIQVLEAGTGFMCVKREVVQMMIDSYPELRHKLEMASYGRDGWLYGLFDTMVEPITRRFLSEDYAFCRRWRDLGGSVYLNTRCNLMHSGQHVFFGNFIKSISHKSN
ncbi:hypothetical protein JKP88DRAFT_161702 [Tribonema minus]|uniref:Uncharacterized protein n=1 Tax=Tribonema minus TaxID=303371 RepID=A0A835Z539_9STRA|nr:hypothetical protein JKP88DRAFT_161702 [Tribonema minus]